MSGSWDAMLAAEESARFSSQAGLASIQTRDENELQRRRVLARLTKPELIDAVIAAEGLVTAVPTVDELAAEVAVGLRAWADTADHECESCATCGVHEGRHDKCCGCYDGVCCQTTEHEIRRQER